MDYKKELGAMLLINTFAQSCLFYRDGDKKTRTTIQMIYWKIRTLMPSEKSKKILDDVYQVYQFPKPSGDSVS